MLDLAALLTFAACVAAGLLVLRRHLPGPRAAGVQPVCLGCGGPASALSHDSFACPNCGRDVRDAGIARPTGRPDAGPLWAVLWLAVLVVVVVAAGAGMLTSVLPQRDVEQTELWLTPSSKAYAGIHVTLHQTRRYFRSDRPDPERARRGTLYAGLYTLDGDAAALEVDAVSRLARVVAPDGRVVTDRAELDEDVVRQWMASAGLDVENSLALRFEARAAFAEFCDEIDYRPRGHFAPIALRPGVPAGFSTSGGSRGWSGPSGPWVPAVAVIAGSVAWLVGTWLLARRYRRRRATKPGTSSPAPSPAHPVAAGPREEVAQ